jgi:Barrel-sandwich domain of CusB or HlyD membrane-fusion
MKSTRFFAFIGILSVVGSLVVVLTAARDIEKDKLAKDAKDVAATPPSNVGGKKLVCLGYVDTEDPMEKIYPDNFPQPSKVKKVLVKEGDTVEKDAPLMEFVDEFYDHKIKQAEIAIALANQEKIKAQEAIKAHPYSVNVAEFELLSKEEEYRSRKRDLDNTLRLLKNDPSLQAERESKEAFMEAALKSLEAAKWKVKLMQDFVPKYLVDMADVGIRNAENLRDQALEAKKMLACKAPAKGKILRVFAVDGMPFHPTSREPAFWFIKDGQLIVRAEVTQEFSRRVKDGQPARIECESDPSQTWKGKVIKVSDQFLPKRQGGGGGSEIMQVSDDRVLECLISVEAEKNVIPPRYGQKVKVTLGE